MRFVVTANTIIVLHGHTFISPPPPPLYPDLQITDLGLPGTLWVSFSGYITTLLPICVIIVTSYAKSLALHHQTYMIPSYGHYQVLGSAQTRTTRIKEI